MNIYQYLMKDHKKVSTLFTRILKSSSNLTRKRLQDHMLEELLIHAASEQYTFYKKLKKHDISKDEAKHGEKEHSEIKSAIKKLIKQKIGTVEWRESLLKLKREVDHHVKDEEGKMFRQAKKALTSKEEISLVFEMDRMKQQLKRKIDKQEEKQQKNLQKEINRKTKRRIPVRITGIRKSNTVLTSKRTIKIRHKKAS